MSENNDRIRTRKKHVHRTEDDLPQNILEKYDSDRQVQIIKGYRILQVLLYHSNNKTFFEKPVNECIGTKQYYDVIEKPMWLHEVKKKFFQAEYKSITEVIRDIRSIAENCYYFWGPRAPIIEECLQLEKQLDNQILLLPKDLRKNCSLEQTHGKIDPMVSKLWGGCSKSRFSRCSELMLRTWKKRRLCEADVHRLKSDLSKYCSNSQEIINWEKEVLLLPEDCCSLFSMQELPEIGLFFLLVHDQLNLEQTYQIEIERMFLLPKFSLALRKMLNVLLHIEMKEEFPPYDKVVEQLMKRVSKWYETSEKNEEPKEYLTNVGIDFDFFDAMGQENPFKLQSYADLSYYQRVILFKALCNNFISTEEDVQKLLSNAITEKSHIRDLGEDRQGYTYLYCSKFLDFRLYRIKIKMKKDSLNGNSSDKSKFGRSSLSNLFEPNGEGCELIADSAEKMRCVVDSLFYHELDASKRLGKKTNYDLIRALLDLDANLYSKEIEFLQSRNQFRIKFFREWKDVVENCTNESKNMQNEQRVDIEAGETKLNLNYDSNNIDTGNEKAINDFNQGDESESNNRKEIRPNRKKKKKRGKKRRKKDKLESEPTVEQHNCSVEFDSLSESEPTPVGEEEESNDTVDSEPALELVKLNDHLSGDYEPLPFGEEGMQQQEIPAFENEIEQDLEKIEEKGLRNKSVEVEISMVNNNEKDPLSDDNREEKQSRLRRSSVPSYSFDKVIYTDDDDSISEEDTSLSEEDSDDEWEIPTKRSRNIKCKSNKLLKFIGDSQLNIEKENENENSSYEKEVASFETSISATEEMSIVKSEIKLEIVDESETEKKVKPAQKIKVVDFAKLNNSINTTNNALNRTFNKPLPVIQSVNSVARPTIMARPVIVNNPLILHTLRQPVRYRSISPRMGQLLRPANITAAYSNIITKQVRGGAVAGTVNQINIPYNYVATRKYPAQCGTAPQSTTRVIRNIVPRKSVQNPLLREIEGSIGIHANNGQLQYVVNLANGTHVPLSNEQVQKLRDSNNGSLPQKLKIPVPIDVAEKIEPYVVIDD